MYRVVVLFVISFAVNNLYYSKVLCYVLGCGLSLIRRRVLIMVELPASGFSCFQKRCSIRTMDCSNILRCKLRSTMAADIVLNNL